MHLSFVRLFADKGAEALGHIELESDNTFQLPGGEYVVHDLYPLTPEHGTDLFFILESTESGEILLTARLRTEPHELRISPEHLQSPQANQAMGLLQAVLSQAEIQNHLSDRLLQVTQLHLAIINDRLGDDRGELRESMLDELEKQFPGSKRSEIEALLNKMEERTGSSAEENKEAKQ